MNSGFVFIVLVVIIVIRIIIGVKFDSIAENKGHNGYLWWCILFGVVGWLMVIALPDRKVLKHDHETDELPEL